MNDAIENELKAMKAVHAAVKSLKPPRKAFVLRTVSEQLGFGVPAPTKGNGGGEDTGGALPFQTHPGPATGQKPNPKVWLANKRPLTGVEQMACLGFYLTHYEGVQAFKTRDLTALNTKAAGRRFSSAAVFANNAVISELFASAGGGKKQITALGEKVVEALPDRTKVKAVHEQEGRSRRRKGGRPKSKRAKA